MDGPPYGSGLSAGRLLNNRATAQLRAIGLILGGSAATRAEPLLFRVDPLDPRLLLGVGAVMLIVAAATSGIPAWRAARIPAAEALQAE